MTDKIVQNSWRNFFSGALPLAGADGSGGVNDKSDKDGLVSTDGRDYLSPLFEDDWIGKCSRA
jgi:hypothetical protein